VILKFIWRNDVLTVLAFVIGIVFVVADVIVEVEVGVGYEVAVAVAVLVVAVDEDIVVKSVLVNFVVEIGRPKADFVMAAASVAV
jgi:hypothetical protein